MLNSTIGDVLDATARDHPDVEALVYVSTDVRFTYREFADRVNRLAKGLMALGLKPDDKIAVWSNNVMEWVFLQFASAKVGAVLVTVNTYYKSHELEYLLKQSDATSLFLIHGFKDSDYLSHVNTVVPQLADSEPGKLKCSGLPMLKNVIFMEEGSRPGMFELSHLFEMGKSVSDEELAKRQGSLKPEDVINMQYTSGTTGFPKGVMLTHRNIVNNAYYVGNTMGLGLKDRLLIPVPFFHCFGCVMSTLNCVIQGATMVPLETFDPKLVLEAVHKEKCTHINGVPTMFLAELQVPEFDQYDLSSLRGGIMAGATCPVDLMKQVMEKMHAEGITICYGLTEASPVITQTLPDDAVEKRVETVGRVLPHLEAKVVDPDSGEELPPNTPGELVAKGYGIMKGYYKNEEATRQSIRDGWLHTKDQSSMDEEGYFRIMGRIDDMIIRGGENVYPREIEEFLLTEPRISDVSVVGIPSEKYGEEVAAFIVPMEGKEISEDYVKEFCRDKISRFKIPRYVFILDAFPMTASGKIQKYKLRDMAKKKLGC